MSKLFSPEGIFTRPGIGIIRIIVGGFMVYHGWEVFSAETMKNYPQMLADAHIPAPTFMAWLGKITELVAGFFLMIGLFTKLAAIPLIITMLIIAFGMGHGKVWYEDQHPFLFVLLFLVFIFYGSGKWSVDNVIWNARFD